MTDTPLAKSDAERALLSRVSEIDAMFDHATSWGSWMVSAANERESAVNQLQKQGYDIAHKNQARSGNGGKTS